MSKRVVIMMRLTDILKHICVDEIGSFDIPFEIQSLRSNIVEESMERLSESINALLESDTVNEDDDNDLDEDFNENFITNYYAEQIVEHLRSILSEEVFNSLQNFMVADARMLTAERITNS